MQAAGSTAPMKDGGDRYRLVAGVKLDRAGLDMSEAQIAVQIQDGPLKASEIACIAQLPEKRVRDILNGLVGRGLVERVGDGSRKMGRDENYGDFIFPAHLMGAECDLSEAQRKRIIFTHTKMSSWTHYELLRVRRRDEKAEITRAFRDRSLEWHPDRFPGRKGPFDRMLQEIFKQLQEARRVLGTPALRKTYDEEHGHLVVDPEDLAEMRARQKKEARDAKREQEAKERRRRRNPIRKKLEKADEFWDQSQDLEGGGDLVAALEKARLALAYDPSNEARKSEFERLEQKAAHFRSEPWIKRAQSAMNLAKFEVATECFRRALKVDPDSVQGLHGLAYCLCYGGGGEGDLAEASRLAHRATVLAPKDPDAHFALGLCYSKKGVKKKAVESLEKSLQLRPNHAEAKKLLKKLRWPF